MFFFLFTIQIIYDTVQTPMYIYIYTTLYIYIHQHFNHLHIYNYFILMPNVSQFVYTSVIY